MTEREGVTRFRLEHRTGPPGDELRALVSVLEPLRRRLRALGLIGLDPSRYGGVGFGNVSARSGDGRLVVSGTQTGGLEEATADHYALVLAWSLEGDGVVTSVGRTPPSSEVMTHAALYAAVPQARVVLHGHHRGLWRAAARLGLRTTPVDVAYGTPRMAWAMREAVLAPEGPRVVAMLGHEDGVLAWGPTGELALAELERALERAG